MSATTTNAATSLPGPAPQAGTAGDPSMEDILASIRRILSEDEAAPATQSPAAEPAPPERREEDDVLLLEPSMLVQEPAAEPETVLELEALPEPSGPGPVAVEPPAPERPAMTAPQPTELVAPEAAAAAAFSVGNLVRTLAVERSMQVHPGGRTIEDIVREEIRALLKQWLDANLPPMVERLVAAEIARVVSHVAP